MTYTAGNTPHLKKYTHDIHLKFLTHLPVGAAQVMSPERLSTMCLHTDVFPTPAPPHRTNNASVQAFSTASLWHWSSTASGAGGDHPGWMYCSCTWAKVRVKNRSMSEYLPRATCPSWITMGQSDSRRITAMFLTLPPSSRECRFTL